MIKTLVHIFFLVTLAAAVTLPFVRTAAAADAKADVAAHKSCKYCGMDREKFAHSRMLIEYDDGSTVATCSLHCTAVDLANNIDKAPRMIKVADYAEKTLINAEQASWVILTGKPGVMTKNAKWAFAGKAGAESFMKENGGKAATFDEAMKASYEDMYQDTKMIRERRQMKMKKEGHGMKY